jgi:hypothetical protein
VLEANGRNALSCRPEAGAVILDLGCRRRRPELLRRIRQAQETPIGAVERGDEAGKVALDLAPTTT